MGRASKKKAIAASGPWLPMPLDFLRSRACAELSTHAAKLLMDVLALLGPNATQNGDICITPSLMLLRGWTSRETLGAAVRELVEHGLLAQTRHGERADCSLYALTLYPLDCDLSKLDVRPGSYRQSDYMGQNAEAAMPPTENRPARWRRVRKTQIAVPPRDDTPGKRPATGQNTRD